MTPLELHVFDFDGTLFRSPDAPDWGDTSWFVSEASLGEPCVPQHPGSDWWVGATVAQAKKSIGQPETYAIMVTGRSSRQGGYRFRIPELLKQAGLNFDEVHLNPGGTTSTYKGITVFKLLRTYDFTAVHMWDDEPKNLAAVENVCVKMGVEFVPHLVRSTPHPVECGAADLASRVASRWLERHR